MKTNTRFKLICLTILLLAILVSSACTSNQLLNDLQIAVNAATAAFPTIAAITNLPPATTTMVMNYLTSANTAIGDASAILGTNASSAVKSAQIIAAFAGVVQPNLPPGTPQVVAAAIQAVSSAIAKFLADLPPPNVSGVSAKIVTPNATQQAQLTRIKTQTIQNLAAIRAHK